MRVMQQQQPKTAAGGQNLGLITLFCCLLKTKAEMRAVHCPMKQYIFTEQKNE